MPLTQKEEGLGQYNTSVQTNDEEEFELVPQAPAALEVNMPFLQFHTPYTRIDHPRDDILYLVSLQNGQLVIEEVPIGQEGGEARRARSVGSRGQARKGTTGRR